ncbi:MAG: hypothetical protein WCI18_12525 [Pseudomonadota bacterium]
MERPALDISSKTIILALILLGAAIILYVIWLRFRPLPPKESENVVSLPGLESIPRETVISLLQDNKIVGIYFLHGTFAGVDPLGVGEVPLLKHVSGHLARAIKWQIRGKGYVEKNVVTDLNTSIPTQMIDWSGENHHLGRLKGAYKLLLALTPSKNGTLLIMGHSHGAQLMAMAQHMRLQTDTGLKLLSFAGRLEFDEKILLAKAHSLKLQSFHWITLGSHLRLDFPLPKQDFLCHFLNIRSSTFGPDLRIPRGDLIQRIATEGSDFLPSLPKNIDLNRQLNQILDQGMSPGIWFKNVGGGVKIGDQGVSFLLDYGDSGIPILSSAKSIFGHGVYFSKKAIYFQIYQYLTYKNNHPSKYN